MSQPVQTSFSTAELNFSVELREAMDREINFLLEKGAIEPCSRTEGDFISHIFSRAKKDSNRLRIILNLRNLNIHVKYEHFKMERLETVCDLVEKGDFFTSIDLKDAYFAIPIHPEHRKFLRFFWGKQVYQYRVMCFGLTCAPRVFTNALNLYCMNSVHEALGLACT